VFVASTVDLLRFLAVPVLGVAAWRDIRTRRVPNEFWYPLVGLGIVLLLWQWITIDPGFQRTRLLHSTLLSVGVVIPLAYAFWRFGAFGGADAKALMALAILFPTYPIVYFPTESIPLIVSRVGVFSLTILTNAVLVGISYPVVLALRNLLAGQIDRRMFVAKPVTWDEVESLHGGLRSAPPDGDVGLDLDALRMYLRWRGTDLATLRSDPGLRAPETLPDSFNDPTDGAVRTDLTGLLGTESSADVGSENGGDESGRPEESIGRENVPTDSISVGGTSDQSGSVGVDAEDDWGAAAFLSVIEDGAYGTSPSQLRSGLDVLVDRDTVWVSPGLPFLVPLFVGLLLAVTVGDLLVGLMALLAGL
jgi:preflagellin peptidase FlaK